MAFLRILKRDGTVIDTRVDEDEWDYLSRFHWNMAGGKGSLGKYVRRADGVYLHRLVAYRAGLVASLEIERGQRGKWLESIDHINGDKLDNRAANLRVANRKQQMRNPANPLMVTNRSGVRGVSLADRPHFPWYAWGTVDGKTLSLGTFATFEEAVAARKAWERTGKVPPPSGRIRPDNTTGVRGVYRDKRDPPLPKPWFARAFADRKIVHLGYFATKDEAAAARKAWDDSH